MKPEETGRMIDRILLPGKIVGKAAGIPKVYSAPFGPALFRSPTQPGGLVWAYWQEKILLGGSNEQLKANYLMAIGGPARIAGFTLGAGFFQSTSTSGGPVPLPWFTAVERHLSGFTAPAIFWVDILGKQKRNQCGVSFFGANAITVYAHLVLG